MSARWPEDIEPEIPSLRQWISGDGYSLDAELPGYPGGREVFDRYFEAYPEPGRGWLVRRKWRVQILSMKYGDKTITDQTVKERFHRALREYDTIQITNDNLGGDPSIGQRKEFVIEYRNLNNDDNRFLKRRKLLESETVDFSWDITKVMYGHLSDTWSLDRFPVAFQNLFWALDHGDDVEVGNKTLDCDPAPGLAKRLDVSYGSSKHPGCAESVGEYQRLKFRARWG